MDHSSLDNTVARLAGGNPSVLQAVHLIRT